MATQIADVLLHIDETLEDWQNQILDDHMRLQDGVIASGHISVTPHLMLVEYNPECASAMSLLRMIERHGYHAERVG